MTDNQLLMKAALTVLSRTVLITAALLVPAASWDWPRGWTLILLVFFGTALSFARLWFRDRDLLRQRVGATFHEGQPMSDRLLVAGFIAALLGSLFGSSMDIHRLGWSPEFPTAIRAVGLIAVVAGAIIWVRALKDNSFGAIAVTNQAARSHRVVDHGLYGVVRHPMYTGFCLILIGQPVWLGSLLGLGIGLTGVLVIALRSVLEERFLSRELNGYEAYAQRVRCRLIPGIW